MSGGGSVNVCRSLLARELGGGRHGAAAVQSRRLCQGICPNSKVQQLDVPEGHISRFSPCGQYLMCFAAGFTQLVVYRFTGPRVSWRGEAEDAEVATLLASFSSFFTLMYRLPLAPAGEVLARDVVHFMASGSLLLLASHSPYVPPPPAAAQQQGAGGGGGGGHADPLAALPVAESIQLHLVRIADGVRVGGSRLEGELVDLGGRPGGAAAAALGVAVHEDLITVLAVRSQVVQVLQVVRGGEEVVHVRSLGPHVAEDDELVLRTAEEAEERWQRRRRAAAAAAAAAGGGGATERDASGAAGAAAPAAAPAPPLPALRRNASGGLVRHVDGSYGTNTMPAAAPPAAAAAAGAAPGAPPAAGLPSGAAHAAALLPRPQLLAPHGGLPRAPGAGPSAFAAAAGGATAAAAAAAAAAAPPGPPRAATDADFAALAARQATVRQQQRQQQLAELAAQNGPHPPRPRAPPQPLQPQQQQQQALHQGLQAAHAPRPYVHQQLAAPPPPPQPPPQQQPHAAAAGLHRPLARGALGRRLPHPPPPPEQQQQQQQLHGDAAGGGGGGGDGVQANGHATAAPAAPAAAAAPLPPPAAAAAGGGSGSTCITGVRQRLLSYLYNKCLRMHAGNPRRQQREALVLFRQMDVYRSLLIRRAQLLDRHHLLLDMRTPAAADLGPQVPAAAAAAGAPSQFFLLLNLQTTLVEAFGASAEKVLEHYLREAVLVQPWAEPLAPWDRFNYSETLVSARAALLRGRPSKPAAAAAAAATTGAGAPAVSGAAAGALPRPDAGAAPGAVAGGAGGGGGVEHAPSAAERASATRALLQLMPPAAGSCSLSSSPYLDTSLYHFDERIVSPFILTRPCLEQTVAFRPRNRLDRSGFRLEPGPYEPLVVRDRRLNRCVTYMFHPEAPFVMAVFCVFQQQTLNINYRA